MNFSPEQRRRIVDIERAYRAQGIYAYAFIYCHTCQELYYHYPITITPHNSSEQRRIAERVANDTAYNHMHAFHPQHNVQVWMIGFPTVKQGEGGHRIRNEDFAHLDPYSAQLFPDELERRVLENFDSPVKQ